MIKSPEAVSVERLCCMIDLTSQTMDDYMYVYDFQQDFYYISRQAKERFRIPSNAFHNVIETLQQFVYQEDFEPLKQNLEELIQSDRCSHNMEYRWLSNEGEPIWINCRGTVVRQEDGAAQYMVGCINEIGVLPKADNRSGLLLDAGLENCLASYHQKAPEGYCLRIKIGDLRGVNARFGLEVGELVVRRTVEGIQQSLYPGQQLYRIMGNEFLILDVQGGTWQQAGAQFALIRQKIETFARNSRYELTCSLYGGILMCEDVQQFTYSEVMRCTAFALNEAKAQGNNTSRLFRKDRYQRYLRQCELVAELRRAVNQDFAGFESYFQPVQTLDGTLIGAEALLRFRSEQYGMIPPTEFIPVLEESGLIVPVGRWMMDQALEGLKTFQTYLPSFFVSLNVSYVQVSKTDVAHEIVAAVQRANVPPSSVVVELTESGMIDPDDRFSDMWSHLKEFGIRLAVDNFDTGCANFQAISALHPDIIKISRSFTAAATKDETDFVMLQDIRKLTQDLSMQICIEGIETERERDRMDKLGADCCQGFYFGHPCSQENFIKRFLQTKRPDTPIQWRGVPGKAAKEAI
jgi:EAL domain-containing protein (putative c-di-GMP-specific phosphodiesterase class I)/GGDEF domain-containing protein/uncharacterized protein YcgL (UPF0745 family)